jgi:chromosome partitioning protein
MALVIAVVSQKGGVGKSTCARLVAREYAQAGWNVKIADLDVSQGTSFDWHVRRLQQNLKPSLAVERFGTVDQALKAKAHHDLIVLDGAPHSTASTLKMVEASTLAVLPSGLSLEDLKPQVLLAHELVK